jgi:GNAT superfamily N-acetyltransferase
MGRRAIIRPAHPLDRALYVAAVGSLSPRARFQRFFAPNWPLRERDIDRLMDLDPRRQAVWLALDSSESIGLGAARFAIGPEPGTAEVAIAVLDSCHGRGLGGALFDRVLAGARERGLGTLVAETLDDNHAAMGLLSSRGFSMGLAVRGVIDWRLNL